MSMRHGTLEVGSQRESAPAAWRIVASLLAVAAIVYLNSERVYWDYDLRWVTTGLADHLIGVGFYAGAVAGAFWCLGRFTHRGLHQVILAGAVFAWTVEGVIVYVMHEGGPLDPVLPLMFVGWHGVRSFTVLVFGVRRALVRWSPLLVAGSSAAFGLLWGLWATNTMLPGGGIGAEASGVAPSAPEFGIVAVFVVVALAAAHLVLDRLAPWQWVPTARSGLTIAMLTSAYAALGVAAIWWGPLRWLLLVSAVMAALATASRGAEGPSILAAMAGRIRAPAALALLPAAGVAAVVYGSFHLLDVPTGLLEGINLSLIVGQISLGTGALAWSMHRTWRNVRRPARSRKVRAWRAARSGR